MNSNPSVNVGTTRWMSPELLDPNHSDFKDGQRTKASDCYALGMVIYEVLSGQVPFVDYHILFVPHHITSGERPKRPKREWFTGDLWGMLEICWSSNPIARPTIGAVFECLERASPIWKPLPPCDYNEVTNERTSPTGKPLPPCEYNEATNERTSPTGKPLLPRDYNKATNVGDQTSSKARDPSMFPNLTMNTRLTFKYQGPLVQPLH